MGPVHQLGPDRAIGAIVWTHATGTGGATATTDPAGATEQPRPGPRLRTTTGLGLPNSCRRCDTWSSRFYTAETGRGGHVDTPPALDPARSGLEKRRKFKIKKNIGSGV